MTAAELERLAMEFFSWGLVHHAKASRELVDEVLTSARR